MPHPPFAILSAVMTDVERVLPISSLAEAAYYLMVTPCAACASGPLETNAGRLDRRTDTGVLIVPAICRACGTGREILFATARLRTDDRWPAEPIGAADGPEWDEPSGGINPNDEPSEIIDVAGWLMLFTLLSERASRQEQQARSLPDRSACRRLQMRAAACLTEALKFYDADNDLPPEEAFFAAASRRQFREHPELFTRDRLIGLLARLPWSRNGRSAGR